MPLSRTLALAASIPLSGCGRDLIQRDWSTDCILQADGRETDLFMVFDVGGSSKQDGRTYYALEGISSSIDVAWEGDFIGAGEDAYDLVMVGIPEEGESTFHLEGEYVYDDSEGFLEGSAQYWVEAAGDTSLVYAGDCNFYPEDKGG